MPTPHPAPTRRLPSEPSVEQLRKQAKDLLEQYRTGHPGTVAEVNQFERDPDPATFALSDAQRVLARAYGYESWPKLKAFLDGANVESLAEAVQAGDLARARTLLNARPELVGMDMAENNEHRALHYAVLRRNVPMVRLLMESGADSRKGIFPHRDATSAFAIARERGYADVVAVMEEVEQHRREALSCPNATVSPVQEQINSAIREGDNSAAIRLLAADESLIRACDRDGRSPLHVAAEEANFELVEWLLSHGANARKQDSKGLTPLDRAALAADPRNTAAQQFPAIAKRLLFAGADVSIRGAVAMADAARVHELVSGDPGLLRDIHWTRGGLLSLAVNHGQLEMVRLLLDLGADADERIILHELEKPTTSWGTPLWYAALAGRRDIAELLLARGADPNANVYASGWPLRNAYRHKDGAVKQLLLEHGAKPQPYMVAEAHDTAEAKRMLDADHSEELASELAWSAACHGCPAIVELAVLRLQWTPGDPRWHWILIQPIRGVDPDGRDHEGFFTCLEILLPRVDLNLVRRMGATILHFAAARQGTTEPERVRFAAMLLDHGIRLDLRDDLLQSTPLGWACRWGHKGMVELLIARGAPVNEPDAEPWAQPLAWATKMEHTAIVVTLSAHYRTATARELPWACGSPKAMKTRRSARAPERSEFVKKVFAGVRTRHAKERAPRGQPASSTVLIARGAPVNEPDAEPWAQPLAWATKMEHTAIEVTLSAHYRTATARELPWACGSPKAMKTRRGARAPERSEFVKKVFAGVRTRHAKERAPRGEPHSARAGLS